MGALYAHNLDGLSPETLSLRLARETAARQHAEELLESKSRALFEANETLRITASALDSQRTQLNIILDHTLAAIFLVREDMTIRQANKAAIAMFGLGEDYFADTLFPSLFDQTDGASPHAWLTALAAGPGGEALREAAGMRVNGETFPIEFGVTSTEHEDKRYSVWIIRDITERKREEAKRVQLERELSQAQKFEALGTLASGVAHEINTPIQYISDNVRYLQDTFGELIGLLISARDVVENGDAEATRSLRARIDAADLDFLAEDTPQAIDQSLEGLAHVAVIVKAIKEFSHPGSEDKAPVDINKAIETTVAIARNQWKYVADLTMDLDDDAPLVPCRASDINQVILNLIVNAADAIEEAGRGAGEIRIATKPAGEFVEIAISDTGCGMPADVRERIFDPFFTTKDVGKGSGQGLAIAYAIVKHKHGGRIDCRSEEGKGTTFTIKLPLKPREGLEER